MRALTLLLCLAACGPEPSPVTRPSTKSKGCTATATTGTASTPTGPGTHWRSPSCRTIAAAEPASPRARARARTTNAALPGLWGNAMSRALPMIRCPVCARYSRAGGMPDLWVGAMIPLLRFRVYPKGRTPGRRLPRSPRPRSRRAQAGALELAARVISGGRAGAGELAWHGVATCTRRPSAPSSPRATGRQPSTGSSARPWRPPRGVAPGSRSEAEYRRAIDVPSVRVDQPPTPRARGERGGRSLRDRAERPEPARAARPRHAGAHVAGGLRREELVRLTRADCAHAPEVRVPRGRAARSVWSACRSRPRSSWSSGSRRPRTRSRRCARVREPRPRAPHEPDAERAERREDPRAARAPGWHRVLHAARSPAVLRDGAPRTWRPARGGGRAHGHSDVRTTSRYSRRALEAKRKAASLLVVP